MLSTIAVQLTLEHRRRVGRLADLTAADAEPHLRSFDSADIDGWWQRVANLILSVVTAGFDVAGALAGDYLAQHAAIEGVSLDPVTAEVDVARVIAAMQAQTVARAKKQIGDGQDSDTVRRLLLRRGTGTVRRLTAAGSRETILETFDQRPVIVGYRRVTASDACSFCLMLAGRGAVYRSQQAASGVAGRPRGTRRVGQSYHDHCRCTVEPLYDFDL